MESECNGANKGSEPNLWTQSMRLFRRETRANLIAYARKVEFKQAKVFACSAVLLSTSRWQIPINADGDNVARARCATLELDTLLN